MNASTSSLDLHSVMRAFSAGSIAAAFSKTVVAPIDRVKLVLQLQTGQHTRHYNGIVDCFSRLCAEQGVWSLWRGNTASLMRCVPSQTMNIFLRDLYRTVLLKGIDSRRQKGKFAAGNMMAGGAAGATTLLMLYPLDFARTRLAVDSTLNGIIDCFRKVVAREGGLGGVYRGFFISLQFVVTSRAIFFGIFDTARAEINNRQQQQISFASMWCVAQSSIICSNLLCYPMDTIRRHLMVQSGSSSSEKNAVKYTGSLDCLTQLIKKEGATCLYRGSLTNSLRCTSGALILCIYYELLKYM